MHNHAEGKQNAKPNGEVNEANNDTFLRSNDAVGSVDEPQIHQRCVQNTIGGKDDNQSKDFDHDGHKGGHDDAR